MDYQNGDHSFGCWRSVTNLWPLLLSIINLKGGEWTKSGILGGKVDSSENFEAIIP